MADKDEELAVPRDAKIVKSLSKSMGVEHYGPSVMPKFMELWYCYDIDVLTDAQVYSEHAGKSEIDCDDVKLAIQSKVLLELAQNRNKIPLPETIGPGVPLPPDPDTLISPNYQLAISNKRPAEPIEGLPIPTHLKQKSQICNRIQRVSFCLPKRQRED